MKKQNKSKSSPFGMLWGWGKPYHGKFILSVILAVMGVACQMIPYFCVVNMIATSAVLPDGFGRPYCLFGKRKNHKYFYPGRISAVAAVREGAYGTSVSGSTEGTSTDRSASGWKGSAEAA